MNASVVPCWEGHLFGAADSLSLTRTANAFLTDLGTSCHVKHKLATFPLPIMTSGDKLQSI